jgi:hypothetical protein
MGKYTYREHKITITPKIARDGQAWWIVTTDDSTQEHWSTSQHDGLRKAKLRIDKMLDAPTPRPSDDRDIFDEPARGTSNGECLFCGLDARTCDCR